MVVVVLPLLNGTSPVAGPVPGCVALRTWRMTNSVSTIGDGNDLVVDGGEDDDGGGRRVRARQETGSVGEEKDG